ncbi:hypothetical protein SLA2020_336390 [Shorea laevis]
MEKAFHRMEWSFLLRIFALLGFNSKWIQLVGQCISTASFSILLDGSPFGLFSSSRGIKQGDPLSPFLFILGSEALSRLISRAEHDRLIHGIKIARGSPQISHLLFADDLMIFAKAKPSEANNILDCLTTYSQWSGQKINFHKSSIFFSKNTAHNSIANIKSILSLQQISPKAKYLGLPLFVNKNKKRAFEDIKASILNRINGWKAKLLSQAARTTLIKSVANATPVYTMSAFFLPKAIWLDIDSSLRKFWWGYPQEKKHCLSLMGWKNICKPICLGGLGLRQMEFLNKALLAKLGWSILNNLDSLWVRSLSAKYLRSVDFLSVSIKPSDSWIWKSIFKNKEIIQSNACWVISPDSLNIWLSLGSLPSLDLSLRLIPTLSPYLNTLFQTSCCRGVEPGMLTCFLIFSPLPQPKLF